MSSIPSRVTSLALAVAGLVVGISLVASGLDAASGATPPRTDTDAAARAAATRTTIAGRTPTHVKRKVVLQRRAGARWATVAQRRTAASGRYSFRVSAAGRTAVYRVKAPRTRIHGKPRKAWVSRTYTVRGASSRPRAGRPSTGRLAYRVVAAGQREYVHASHTDILCGPTSGSSTLNTRLVKAETGRPQWVEESNGGGQSTVYVATPLQATWMQQLNGCSVDQLGNKTPCQTSRTGTPDGGHEAIGVIIQLRAGARKADVYVTPDKPSVGFQGADNSVCHVEEISQSQAPGSKRHFTVPVSTLRGTKPFTLRHSGMNKWTTDLLGKPASITQTWTHSVTLQRVNLDGSRLR